MVGELTDRRLDRADWELLIRQYEAGAPLADIMARTGLSASWIRARIRTFSREPPARRALYHFEALRRELMRAEAELLQGRTDAAVKRMRALNMLVKLEKELNQPAVPDLAPANGADDIAALRAEIKCRLDRLRAAGDTGPIPDGADGSGTEMAEP